MLRIPAVSIRPKLLPASRWVVSLFFGGVLLLGLLLFRDYGVSWDETVDQFNGVVNTNYVAERLHLPGLAARLPTSPPIPPLNDYLERDHGPAFEYPLVMLTTLLGVGLSSQGAFYLRHLLVFLVSFGGLLAFYGLARHRFGDWRLALLGTVWLLGTPRLFAENFYNAKDAVFLALFTIGMYTLARLLAVPGGRRGLWHGLACGAAIGLRVNGVLLLPLTVAGLLLTTLATLPGRRRPLLLGLLGWLPATAGAAVLLWPWLWEAPWINLRTAFDNLSHFRWEGQVLYQGALMPATELPWHYPFGWILLTTPLAYLAAFGLGVVLFGGRLLRSFPASWRTEAGRLDLLFGAWLAGPLLAVVVLHSVLYDGWRHLYFIYPPLLLFGVSAVQQLVGWARARPGQQVRRAGARLLLLALALGSLEPLWRIARDHPNQQVYFNGLLSAPALEAGYERDYWGLSFRQGLEWILRNDPAARIPIATEYAGQLENNLLILSDAERARLVVVPREQAVYFLAGYRWHPHPYEGYGWEVHAEYSGGVKILSVFKPGAQ